VKIISAGVKAIEFKKEKLPCKFVCDLPSNCTQKKG
jgi:hypothetical protein